MSIARFAVGLMVVTRPGQERKCNVQGWQWLGLQQPAFQAAKAKDSLALTDQSGRRSDWGCGVCGRSLPGHSRLPETVQQYCRQLSASCATDCSSSYCFVPGQTGKPSLCRQNSMPRGFARKQCYSWGGVSAGSATGGPADFDVATVPMLQLVVFASAGGPPTLPLKHLQNPKRQLQIMPCKT